MIFKTTSGREDGEMVLGPRDTRLDISFHKCVCANCGLDTGFPNMIKSSKVSASASKTC